MLRALFSEYFSQNGGIAGVFDLKVDSVANVIKKGFETGVAVSFCGLLGSLGESGQERQDFIRGDGFQFPITKFIGEPGEKKVIVFQRIFFSNWPCDTLDKNG